MKSSLPCLQSSLLLPRVALLIAAACGPLALAPAASAQDFAMPTSGDPTVTLVDNGHGRINYAAGVVKATGYGAPPAHAHTPAQAKLMALGAARADALRTLAMAVSSIQVTANTKVKNYELQSDVVQTQLSAILQSPRVLSETFQADGTAVVIVDLPMYGANSVAAAVLPEVLPAATASATPAATVTWTEAPPIVVRKSTARTAAFGNRSAFGNRNLPNGAGADANGNFIAPPEPATRIVPAVRSSDLEQSSKEYGYQEPGPTPASDNGPFTSVIIDCRGLNIESVMSPKLMDTSGREVYGTVHVSADYAIETGIVGYPRSMRDALHTARAGSHPLIVKGLNAADTHRFNPVISAEDGDRILAANDHDHFLEQVRVIFLVDPIR